MPSPGFAFRWGTASQRREGHLSLSFCTEKLRSTISITAEVCNYWDSQTQSGAEFCAILGDDLALPVDMEVATLKPISQDGLRGGFKEAVSRRP